MSTLYTIPVSGSIELQSLVELPPLGELPRHGGGHIEYVPGKKNGQVVTVIVNEEGKLRGLPFNPRATKIYRDFFMTDEITLVGTALIWDGETR